MRQAGAGEPWRYLFCFLSPEDYTQFFSVVRRGEQAGWRSGRMQSLLRPEAP
jgi:hypothetical protein